MFFCYLDEAGDFSQITNSQPNEQPVFVLCGLFLDHKNLRKITEEFYKIKKKFFPSLLNNKNFHEACLLEIKGGDIRHKIRTGGRDKIRHSIGFINDVMTMLKKYDCKIVASIFIKEIAGDFKGKIFYAHQAQALTKHFQNFLQEKKDIGLVVADSRNNQDNSQISHAIFTQKIRSNDDAYPAILEVPLVGHSQNHVGLQLTDILCSGLLFPIASQIYSAKHLIKDNVHCNDNFILLQKKFGEIIKDLQFRYRPADSHFLSGGIHVIDKLNKYKANRIWQ